MHSAAAVFAPDAVASATLPDLSAFDIVAAETASIEAESAGVACHPAEADALGIAAGDVPPAVGAAA